MTTEEAAALGNPAIVKDYRNGRDLTEAPRGVKVIDAFGLSADELRTQFPAAYQWLLERVKPERDLNNRESRKKNWWLFGEANPKLRTQLSGLPRYIATVETAKHRLFQFLDASILPDNKLVAIALNDPFHLGVLSSHAHGQWAQAAGSTLEDRPVYVKTTCFETFPFPDEDTGLTPALRHTIGLLAEQIDTHRKRVLGLLPAALAPSPAGAPCAATDAPGGLSVSASNMPFPHVQQANAAINSGVTSAAALAHTEATALASVAPAAKPNTAKPNKDLTLTGLYNVLQALREGRPLTAKEKTIHSTGLVGVLKTLHDELDAAVLAAYGWSDLAPAQPTPAANVNPSAKP
ncbi:MAG: hypothetical protein IPH37_11915 [Burkholderiales bacterium]|nr:hypothetical protein [Burkholderiales bacterium]